ncbi:putative transcriptional regulatory protein C139.03-like protein 2, partial [Colletotrichum chlorophyti]
TPNSNGNINTANGVIKGSGTGRKVERSCNLCHRRKIRCDKKLPCSSCARGGFPCFYPQPGQPVRRVRKTTIADVASRISDLEKTLTAGVGQQKQQQHQHQHEAFHGSPPVTTPVQPSAPYEKGSGDEILVRKGTSSQYFDEVLISRVIEEEHDIQSVLTTPGSEPVSQGPSPFNPMGLLSAPDPKINLAELMPPKWGASELWKTYVEHVEVCNKVLHRPTAEVVVYTALNDPHTASLEALAVTFAVFFVATVALEPTTAQNITGEDKVTSLLRFKTGLEQAFAKADFLEHPSVKLLEALCVYLAALRIHNPGRGLWTLNGLAIRAAQSIGLHRDGTKLGLSPFESEIRRRLWWHLIARDGRSSEDYGIQTTTSFNPRVGVQFPSNLEDSDIYPEMKELPPPRPGWTPMTMGLINIQFARAWHRLAMLASSWHENPTPESVRAQIIEETSSYAEGFLQHCNPVIPQQRQTLFVSRFLIRKMDIVTRQQWHNLEHPDAETRLSFATEKNLQQVLSVLDDGRKMATDELLRPYRWTVRAYPQYHMLLYVLWHLCAKPQGPSVERAWKSVDETFATIGNAGGGFTPPAKMTILDGLRAKALTVRQELRQHNVGGPGGDGGDGEEAWKADNSAAEKESYPTPGGTDDRSEAEGHGNALDSMEGTDGMDWTGVMQDFPDWATLMAEFQVDGLDFQNYLN